MSKLNKSEILKQLNISTINAGACWGEKQPSIEQQSIQWSSLKNTTTINSYNPHDEQLISSVVIASESDYERVLASSEQAFKEWRSVPAPLRVLYPYREFDQTILERVYFYTSVTSVSMA